MPSLASSQQIARYKLLLERYRLRTSAGLAAAWDGLSSYGEEDIPRFVARTSPLLAGAKAASVATASAFFAQALGIRPPGVDPAAINLEPRVRDPFLALWHAISEGRPNTEALLAGRSMAEAVGFNFVTSIARLTGDHAAKASNREVGWERVPGAGACDWCETVAGQLYHSAESADFGHDRCNCDAVPAG